MDKKDIPTEGSFTNVLPSNIDYSEHHNFTILEGTITPGIILEEEAKEYDWKNIDNEEFRVYIFQGGCKVVIDHPLKLYVSKSGGHRLFDSDGISHYIPPKWIHIFWKAKNGQPNFRF